MFASLLLLGLLAVAQPAAWAAQPAENVTPDTLKARIAALDSVAMSLFRAEDFQASTQVRLQQLDAMRQLGGENDTAYVAALVQLARCYYRTERYGKAVEAAQKVVDLYPTCAGADSAYYAYYLDNLALYQASNQQSDESLANSLRALQIYERQGKRDYHLAIMLAHVAEALVDHDRAEEAIRYELRGLSILRDEVGEHSEEYLQELLYLQKYYEMAGQNDKASRLKERYDKLKEEADKGIVDLPEPIEFTSVEQCHEHNDDAMAYCQYYLDHYLSAPQMEQAAQYIMSWSFTTADVHIGMGDNEAKLMGHTDSAPFAVSYIAACSLYALATDSAQFSYDMYEFAIISTVNHYLANKRFTGSVPLLERYVKAYDSSYEKLQALIRKDYNKLLAGQAKAEKKK